MAKLGPLGDIGLGLGGLLALGTGLGAAGIGPLSGLFSAGAGGLTAGADAATAGAAPALDAATAGITTGAADAATAGVGAASPTAFDAGSFLIPGTDTALTSGTAAAGSAADAFSGFPSIPNFSSLGGTATPSTQVADATAPSAFTDVGAGTSVGGTNPFFFPGTSSPLTPGTISGSLADTMAAASAPAVDATGGLAAPSDAGTFFTPGTSTPLTTFADSTGIVADTSSAAPDGTGGTPWWQNPRNLLLAAPLALAGGEMLFGNSMVPGSGPVTAAAQQAATNEGTLTGAGTQNMSYINTGALPAGAQTEITNAANAAKTQIASSFASMGVPPGSTMEREQMAAVDQNVAAQQFQVQQQLLQAGISQFNAGGAYGGLVNQADLALMNAQIQQEQELEAALANFAGAAAAGWAFQPGTGTA